MKKDVAIVAYAWFPNNQALVDSLQQILPYRIRHFVMSEADPRRVWKIPDDVLVKPIVVSGFRVSVLSRYININPAFPRYLGMTDPSVIIVNGWADPSHLWVQRFARKRRVPLITWMSGRDRTRTFSERSVRMISNLLAKRLIGNSRFIFVYGSKARDEALSLGANPETVVIVKQTIDERHFDYRSNHVTDGQRAALRARIGADGRPLFLCISQLVARKGIGDLLQAFRLLRARGTDVQLLLIGKGPLDSIVQRGLQEFRGSFIWLESVPYTEIPGYYTLADYFVFPTHFDTWGNVVNESHCARLPIIASDGAHAVANLVEHRKSGLVYKAGSVRDLADLLEYAATNPVEMRKLASRGYEFIRSQWNVNESAGIWAEYIRKAVDLRLPEVSAHRSAGL